MTRHAFIRVCRAFTLVELIAVCAIMVMLLLMAMPAFERVAYGSGVNIAAKNLDTKLRLARNKSIAENAYYGVAFPVAGWPFQDSFTENTDLPEDYFHQSYRMFQAYPKNGAITTQSVSQPGSWPTSVDGVAFWRWVPGEKWEFLPAGVVIAGVDNDLNVDTNNSVSESDMEYLSGGGKRACNNLDEGDIVWCQDGERIIDDITQQGSSNAGNRHFPCVVFGPDGRIVDPPPSDTLGGETFTGRCVNVRRGRFLPVPPGSGSTPAGTLVLELDDSGKSQNGKNILVDHYTGRIMTKDSTY